MSLSTDANASKAVVLGTGGTMGALTGGLLAQSGMQVWFLSRTLAGAQRGLLRAQKQARSEVIARQITCGDYDTMFDEACAQADWIIECVAEDYDIKKSILDRVDRHRKPEAIVSSMTSSLLLERLADNHSEGFQRHFISTHFYNPPGKMAACEICGTARSDPAIVDCIEELCRVRLRRAVIRVRPTAGFAGNRIAFLLFSRMTELAEEYGVEMMDYLIGPYTGRAMPPLATLDLIGLDIHRAIIESLRANTHDAFHDALVLPRYVEAMIASGHLGSKSRDKGGFYRRLESGEHMYVNPGSGQYVKACGPHVQFVEAAKDHIHSGRYREAFRTIMAAKGSEAGIVREILAAYIAYAYLMSGEVTDASDGIEGIDRVMSRGFNWASPSLVVYMLGGRDRAIELLGSQNLPVPELLRVDPASDRHVFNGGRYFAAK